MRKHGNPLSKYKNSRIFQSPNSRLVVNVASLSTLIIAPFPSHYRPEIHFKSRRLTLPRLESLITLPRFTSPYLFITSILYLSQLRPIIVISTSGPRLFHPRHHLGILHLSHLRTRLASAPVCRSYLAIIYIHPDPTSLRLSFWSTFFYLRYQCIVSGMSLTPHRIYVNKPIIVLSSISSSAWSRGSSS